MLNALKTHVTQTLETLRPCSAAIIISHQGQIIFEDYLPGSEPKLFPQSINEHALWPLASATKGFSAGLLFTLIHDGLFQLDDRVGKFLPEFTTPGNGPYDRREVTFRHLASMTSGAQLDLAEGEEHPREADIVLDRISIGTQPGKVFHYHGVAMHILERAIEAATGEDLYDTLKEKILDPLGLENTLYIYQHDAERPLIPAISGEYPESELFYVTSQKGGRFGNSLYTSARDLNRYSQLWLGEGTCAGRTFFSPELTKEAWTYHGMRASDQGRYGILWWLFEQEGGYVISGGLATMSALVPATDVVVTVMRNRSLPPSVSFGLKAEKMAMIEFGKKL
jgi:CubicO group peptidase (beta-lactamase class C family)